MTEGMRKSLFIVDLVNGLGEKGVVALTGYFLFGASGIAW